MADIRYFNEATRLHLIEEIKDTEFAALFPGATAVRRSPGYRLVGLPEGVTRTYDRAAGKWTRVGFLPAQRVVTFKTQPSRHECDARCMNATGRVMNCECSCGGKNHGRSGGLVCERVAA